VVRFLKLLGTYARILLIAATIILLIAAVTVASIKVAQGTLERRNVFYVLFLCFVLLVLARGKRVFTGAQRAALLEAKNVKVGEG
jgi:Ca2+/Na+ antiporter